MRKFYVIIVICLAMTNLILFSAKYIFATEPTSTTIGLVEECSYIDNIKKYYIVVTTEKNPYCIFIGDDNKNFCSNIKKGDAYRISYTNTRYHKDGSHVRCFGIITNILSINKVNYKKELSKIKPLQRASGYLYLSNFRNPSLIEMYLDVLSRQ